MTYPPIEVCIERQKRNQKLFELCSIFNVTEYSDSFQIRYKTKTDNVLGVKVKDKSTESIIQATTFLLFKIIKEDSLKPDHKELFSSFLNNEK